ncbi:alpha/beta-hydrolase [Irpex rosettiformis]|uniref:Alpha/beta-hydrolase n=1 Tax=Irpex rosettiformis TaxID=378272 RepID=A0ACB8TSB6_9APHY|nr:alpha/beta-hydrolase [Irpex rosettiformis]
MSPSPFPAPVSHSMEALPASSPLRELYPEDTYSGGGYFPSPYGRTKYWINGPEGGQKVVLIHGISVPAIAFQKLVPILVKEGLQVLIYDLPGRGYSEAPKLSAYDAELYVVHLALLLQYIKWDKADIVGYSMGGAVAAAFTATFPHLVADNVTLLASAGLYKAHEDDSGEWDAAINDIKPEPEQNPEVSAEAGKLSLKLRELQWEYLPGAKNAFKTSLSSGVIGGLRATFETLGNTSTKRFLVIHGTADKIVPYREAHKINKLVPQAKLVLIKGASHALPFEEGTLEKVADELVPFVTGAEGRHSKYR